MNEGGLRPTYRGRLSGKVPTSSPMSLQLSSNRWMSRKSSSRKSSRPGNLPARKLRPGASGNPVAVPEICPGNPVAVPEISPLSQKSLPEISTPRKSVGNSWMSRHWVISTIGRFQRKNRQKTCRTSSYPTGPSVSSIAPQAAWRLPRAWARASRGMP